MNMLIKLGKTITSLEVAEMVEKQQDRKSVV